MIYLLRIPYKDSPSYWKIGYASDIQKRFSQYEAYNPLIELVAFKEGDLFSEKIHHKYFHLFPQFIEKFHKDEWYITDSAFIREAFLNVSLEGMCDLIWERRNESISSNDYDFWNKLREGRDCSIINETDEKMFRIVEKSKCPNIINNIPELEPLINIITDISSNPKFDDKLRIYCEFRELNKFNKLLTEGILYHYRKSRLEFLYSHFGIDVCRAVSFRAGELKKKISDESLSSPLKKEVYSIFKLKTRYSLKDIKYILAGLYKKLGIKKTAKASDISDFFNVQQVNLYDPMTKKRSAGYELISIK